MYTRVVRNKKGLHWLYSEFLCDTVADIADLPTTKKTDQYGTACCAGSKAYVVDNGAKYILNHNDEWKLIPSSGNNSSSGETTITDDMIATQDEAKAYFGF